VAARAAFKSPEWRDISAAERGALLWKLGDLCEKNAHILATIDAWDNGKPYQQALDEDVGETVAVFRYYAGWADKVYGQTIETSRAKLAYTKHEPLGKILIFIFESALIADNQQVSVARLFRGTFQ
jgi:aldehyde dehydrogenase (NAD+)